MAEDDAEVGVFTMRQHKPGFETFRLGAYRSAMIEIHAAVVITVTDPGKTVNDKAQALDIF